MAANMAGEFTAAYENSAAASYLILSAKDNSHILDYQVQMLLSNRIGGLLEFNMNNTGDDFNCFYNITSKCTLVNYMSRKKFKRNEFLILLLNITNNINHIKDYLLYDSNVLLDERYIYTDPEKGAIYFVYLPFSSYKNDYRAFFLKMIIELTGFCEEESDNFLQKLLEEIKGDLFSLSSLKSRLERLLGSSGRMEDDKGVALKADSSKNVKIDKLDASENIRPQEGGSLKFNKDSETRNIKFPVKSDKSKQINKNSKKYQSNQSLVKQGEKDIKIKSENNKNTIQPQSSSWRLTGQATVFLLLQPVFIAAYIFILSSGLFAGTQRLSAAVISFIIITCIDILTIRLIKERFKNAAGPVVSSIISQITCKMRRDSKEAGPGIETSRIHPQPVKKEAAKSLAAYIGETEILMKPPVDRVKAYFKEEAGDTVLVIDKNSILIGRLESFVDAVIKNNAVGKIHAEVIREDEGYFLMDCNSRNGTYINEKRLLPNTRSPLVNNDFVRFANMEFRFYHTHKPEEACL